MVPLLLQGADRILFQMAMSLGLEVMVKPIIEVDSKELLLPAFPKGISSDGRPEILFGEPEYEEEGLEYDIKYLFGVKPCHIGKISWCEEHKLWQSASVTARYENEIDFLYQTAAILVGIPHWDKESNSRSALAENEVIRKYVNFCKQLEPGW